MCKQPKNVLILLLTLCCATTMLSQSVDSLLVKNLKELLKEKSSSYTTINNTLKKFNRDSINIEYIRKQCLEEDYLDGEIYALNAMGIYCRNTSQYPKAIEYHFEALKKAIKSDNVELRVISLNMLGVVYRRMDAVRTALDYHQEALKLAETVKKPTESIRRSIAVSLNSMGNIYLALAQYDLARELFLKSREIEKSLDNKLGLAINYHNIAYTKEAKGDLDSALEDYKTSLMYNEEINSDLGRVICNNSIGQIFIKKGEHQKAIDILKATFENAKGLRDKFHLCAVYNNLGWAYMEMGNNSQAKNYLEEGLQIATMYKLKSSQAESHHHLATLAEREEDYKKSLTHYKASEALDEETSGETNLQYVNDIILTHEKNKISDQVKSLEEEKESVMQTLQRNKNIWIVSSIVLALLAIMIYILYRQRLLNNEKKILTLEQDMLRSQMNPHFVFNSLNSIKQYIITNEQKNAVHYLNKFAKLIRKILDASRVKEVSLADELETMDLYMSIENIRFSNEINFEVYVDDGVNLDAIKIPSLVLQPFLENALWHGLSSKKGEKKIRLSVEKDQDDFVNISITDNGIGREKAQIIASKKIVKRKSIGIALTKNRLANFVKKNFINSFSLNFKDLKDANNNPLGTEVILQIPLR